MILMVVVATKSVDDKPSKHFTTVPFRPVLTGLTPTLDTSGDSFWPESLENVTMDELKVSGSVGTPLVPCDVTGDVG